MVEVLRSVTLAIVMFVGGCFAPEAGHVGELDTGSSTNAGLGESTDDAVTSAGGGSSGFASVDSGSSSSTGVDEDTSSSIGDDGTSTGEPAPCDLDGPFAGPTLVMELVTESHEDHAWLSADELTVYVSSNRDDTLPGYDIYVGVRDSIDAPFGEILLLTGTDQEDRRPTLTADGLTLYVASSPIGALGYDLMVATRPNLLEEFSALEPVDVVNSGADDSAPSITPDGTTLWFASHRAGDGDLFVAQRRGDGSFAEPMPVAELDTPSEETAPVPSEDGLTIWFASNRPGGIGDYDVWTATRSTLDEDFGAPANVAEVSSEQIDWPTWISPDGCRLYLASRRPDAGDYDLWVAER